MQVDKLSFYPLLLDILTDISDAHFVSIDLELSGVPTKDSYANPGKGKPTLQQRYLEVKAAAERYQILQIGLTCVEQNPINKEYILKPYNFDLSPVIDENRLDIERIFSFQSGALEFLMRVGFDFDKVFTRGVPYLSRDETRAARTKYNRRQDKTAMADIQIKETETDALRFLERIRGEISAWVKDGKEETPEYLNIGGVMDEATQFEADLSRFEKRLVHQLVRAEFPKLVTISKRGFIQIVQYDHEREERIAEGRKRDLEERIGRQKGFRWVIEALLGSNINALDLKECAHDSVTGAPIYADLAEYRAQFHRAHLRIRNNPRVLVGHNCFLDMVYLYKTFIGDLPATVAQFAERLHRLWPVVIDTKYLSTHNCGDISPASSLAEIAAQMSQLDSPAIRADADHDSYAGAPMLHEAGYDSYLTAQIAIRLSAKLEQAGEWWVDLEDPDRRAAAVEYQAKLAQDLFTRSLTPTPDRPSTDGADVDADVPTAWALPPRPAVDSVLASDSSGFTPSIVGGKWKRVGDPTLGPADPGDAWAYNPADLKVRYTPLETGWVGGCMPRFGSDFWRVYGNRMQVFGTVEGVVGLEEAEGEEGEEDGGVMVGGGAGGGAMNGEAVNGAAATTTVG